MNRIPRIRQRGEVGPITSMNGFTQLCVLGSEGDPARFYVGLTNDLAAELAKHDTGRVPYTRNHRPWKITVPVFNDTCGNLIQIEQT